MTVSPPDLTSNMSFPHEFLDSNPISRSDSDVNDPGPTNYELPDASTGSDSTSTTHLPTESQADSVVTTVNVQAPAATGRSFESVVGSNTILSSSPTPLIEIEIWHQRTKDSRKKPQEPQTPRFIILFQVELWLQRNVEGESASVLLGLRIFGSAFALLLEVQVNNDSSGSRCCQGSSNLNLLATSVVHYCDQEKTAKRTCVRVDI